MVLKCTLLLCYLPVCVGLYCEPLHLDPWVMSRSAEIETEFA